MEETESIIKVSHKTKRLLDDFCSTFSKKSSHKKGGNERTLSSVLLYEKFRVSLEYQEEHLIFKNAISRIIRRKYALSSSITADKLLSDLINELSWANYLNPEAIKLEEFETIEQILNRYLILLKYSRSGHLKKHELSKTIIDWAACELNDVFNPSQENEYLLEFTYSILKKGIELNSSKVSEAEAEIQLKIAILSLIFKPDFSQIEFWILKNIYPAWEKYEKDDLKKFARSFDPYYNKIDKALNFSFKNRFLQYAKRNITPFILFRHLLNSQSIDFSTIKENTILLKNLLLEVYDSLIVASRKKVWRGTIRALVFILLTKISLAFILEIPFDRMIEGSVHYLSLIVNISLPPVLMFVAGTFVKSPKPRNREIVAEAITNILTKDKVDDKVFPLIQKRAVNSYMIFNFLYTIFSISILVVVIWLLLRLEFNILSIILFFLFVSVVSFFSFRIRNIALELAMKRSKDDALTSTIEFIFLPFIRIGKGISERFARFNPIILALDFLIEAPFKTIIKIINSWLRFINSKKEELEL